MKYGVGVNSNETTSEIVEKSVEMEKLGFDYVWVADVPSQRYAPTIASAIAEKTSRIRIGLGLMSIFLHSPHQISSSLTTLNELYGNRFELCIGPGDREGLKRVGIKLGRATPGSLLKARQEIVDELSQSGLETTIWLGAQGPKVLGLAKFFDGVLLNFAHPDHIAWAIIQMNLPNGSSTRLGVYAPSYIYSREDKRALRLLRISSAIVALGASRSVLEAFGLHEKLISAKDELKRGLNVEDVLNKVPVEVTEDFAINLHCSQLSDYLSRLELLGIEHVVFGYPQNFSKETIQDLREGLLR